MPNIKRGMMAAAGGAGGEGYQFYAWGLNSFGNLGDGSTTNTTDLATFGARSDGWVDVHIGRCSAGIKDDGTLWTFGANVTYGQLGLGDTTNRSTPVQVGSLVNWSKVQKSSLTGAHHMGAIKTDGTLWMWGKALWGSLGNGTTTPNVSSPIQVGSDTNWSQVTTTTNRTMAIQTDGTLWMWGYGSQGQLGNGGTVACSTPVQIGSDTDWVNCIGGRNQTLALKSTGTIWTWGFQTDGLMANGSANYTKISTPIQVGSADTWASIGCGDSNSGGVLTDGTAWAWGLNLFGQCVDGTTTTPVTAPQQIGSLTDWSKIDWGFNSWHALKTDGTIWGGSINSNRQAIPTTTTRYSSPVQIGSDTNWTDIRGGAACTMALKDFK